MTNENLEREIGKIKWGKNHELVIRYAEFTTKKKQRRRGIDIRLYENSPKYIGWRKDGFWIFETEIENFAAIINSALQFYQAQKLIEQQRETGKESQKS